MVLNKIRTVVFISGTGSNLNSLIRYSLKKKSNIKIVFVISDNVSAKGLDIAKKYKIKSKVYSFKSLKKTEKKILKDLKKKKNYTYLSCRIHENFNQRIYKKIQI